MDVLRKRNRDKVTCFVMSGDARCSPPDRKDSNMRLLDQALALNYKMRRTNAPNDEIIELALGWAHRKVSTMAVVTVLGHQSTAGVYSALASALAEHIRRCHKDGD